MEEWNKMCKRLKLKNNLGWERQKERAETRYDKRGKVRVGSVKRNQTSG